MTQHGWFTLIGMSGVGLACWQIAESGGSLIAVVLMVIAATVISQLDR